MLELLLDFKWQTIYYRFVYHKKNAYNSVYHIAPDCIRSMDCGYCSILNSGKSLLRRCKIACMVALEIYPSKLDVQIWLSWYLNTRLHNYWFWKWTELFCFVYVNIKCASNSGGSMLDQVILLMATREIYSELTRFSTIGQAFCCAVHWSYRLLARNGYM